MSRNPSRERRRAIRRPWIAALLVLLAGCREPPERAPAGPPADGAEPDRATLVDVRDPDDYAAGHYAGSINLQLGYGQFRVRLNDLLGSQPIDLVASDAEQLELARLIAAELRHPVAGGEVYNPAPVAGRPIVTQPVLSVTALAERLDSDDPPLVLDVRSAREIASGYIRGAVYVYPNDVGALLTGLRRDREYAVICEEGWRSDTVVSLMQRAGFEQVWNVIGGMRAWRQAGLPMRTAADETDFLDEP